MQIPPDQIKQPSLDSTAPHNLAERTARLVFRPLLPLLLVAAGLLAGCATQSIPPTAALKEQPAKTAELITLREGNVVKVSFPGSPTLDTVQKIRSDGKINLPLVGEVDAAGLTPPALQQKLVELYSPQLSTKQVTVELQDSSFPVYVTGMVQHPGKVLSDHPMTALEAVMEAGGFDYTKADLKDVAVIRREQNTMKNYKLNLKAVLQGQKSEPFFLKPGDIVYVPERFSMF